MNRLNISLSDKSKDQVDRLADKLGVNRSQAIAIATGFMEDYLDKKILESEERIMKEMGEVYKLQYVKEGV